MDALIVEGGVPLRGKTRTNGSKNSSLPIMAASLLCAETVKVKGVPDLIDIRTMVSVLEELGASVIYNPGNTSVSINSRRLRHLEPPAQLVQRMRASVLVLGPLLACYGRVRLPLPGGCAIGTRPVDLHIKGLSALGAEFTMHGGYIEGRTSGLKGARVYLDYPSVGATENIVTAATMAAGTTILENAATEPEIVDLANFLNSMGARVSGAGTTSIRIEGVAGLGAASHAVIPDRIEAGTLLLAAVITGGDMVVENVLPEHLKPLVAKIREAGGGIEEVGPSAIRAWSNGHLTAVDLKTLPYPGFPTDLQPQFMALLALSSGTSLVTETVFENRFRHVDGLVSMGARIQLKSQHAVIQGQESLTGAPVMASDLRAAAALLLAALSAEGETQINEASHLWRGYSRLEERLINLGARIRVHREEDYAVKAEGS